MNLKTRKDIISGKSGNLPNDNLSQANERSKNSWWKPLLKVLISILALFFVLKNISLEKTLEILSHSNVVYLMLAFFLFIVSKLLSAFRLQHFLNNLIPDFSHRYNLKLYWLGMFYNFFLPGGIGGDGYKVYHLKKHTLASTKDLIGGLLMDRLSGVLLLGILMVSFLIGIPLEFPHSNFLPIFIPLSVIAYYLILEFFFSKFKPSFMVSLLYSFGVQVFQVLSVYCILLALGIHEMHLYYLILFLVSVLMTVLPISFAGLGVRELTFMLGAQYAGLDTQVSVAIALLFYFISLVASSFGMYYHFRTDRLTNNP